MSERYFVSRRIDPNQPVTISGSELVHLTRVMRQKPGDSVCIFDGNGSAWWAVIDSVTKSTATLRITSLEKAEPADSLELTMAVALPKGERQKVLIEKLTELGVTRFIPLVAQRADIKVDENVLERLNRQVIEASKQCGRLRLMEITPPVSTDSLFTRSLPATPALHSIEALLRSDETRCVIAHPLSDGDFGQKRFPALIDGITKPVETNLKIVTAIGPVGGLTDREVELAVENRWHPLDLGRQVYRVETAAIVTAALFLQYLS